MTIKELKKGEFFTKKPVSEPKETQVFIRGDYCRELKKYEFLLGAKHFLDHLLRL